MSNRLHPALKGKSQEEIDQICDDLEDQLTKNFFGRNNWRSSRDQEDAIQKVAHILEQYQWTEFTALLKAVADGDKEEVFRICKGFVDDGIVSVVDQAMFPQTPIQEWLK